MEQRIAAVGIGRFLRHWGRGWLAVHGQPARTEMEFLFPRFVRGGVVIVDDYGDRAGRKQAVDAYRMEIDRFLILNRIDKVGRPFVKVRIDLDIEKDDLVFVSFRIADVEYACRRSELCGE